MKVLSQLKEKDKLGEKVKNFTSSASTKKNSLVSTTNKNKTQQLLNRDVRSPEREKRLNFWDEWIKERTGEKNSTNNPLKSFSESVKQRTTIAPAAESQQNSPLTNKLKQKNFTGRTGGNVPAGKQDIWKGYNDFLNRETKKSTGKYAWDDIGEYGAGNINLYNRPTYKQPNAQGKEIISTVNSISFWDDNEKKEILVPTIVNGKQVTEDDARLHYYETGEYLGKFDTPEEANSYAERLHKQQERIYTAPTTETQQKTWYDPWDFDSSVVPETDYGKEKKQGKGAGWLDVGFMYDSQKKKHILPGTYLQQMDFLEDNRNKGIWTRAAGADLSMLSDEELEQAAKEIQGRIDTYNAELGTMGGGTSSVTIPEDAVLPEYADEDNVQDFVNDRVNSFVDQYRTTGLATITDQFGNMVRIDPAADLQDEEKKTRFAGDMFRHFFGDAAYNRELQQNGGQLSDASRTEMLSLMDMADSVSNEKNAELKFKIDAETEMLNEIRGIQQMYKDYGETMESTRALLEGVEPVQGGADANEYSASDIFGGNKGAGIYGFFIPGSNVNQVYVQHGNDNMNTMDEMANVFDHAFFYLPEEKEMYTKLWEAKRYDEAMAFHQGLVDSGTLNFRYMTWKKDLWELQSDINPIATGAATLATQKLGAVNGIVTQAARLLGDKQAEDPNSAYSWLPTFTNTVRGNIASNAGQGVYNLTGNETLADVATYAVHGGFAGLDSGLDFMAGKMLATKLVNSGIVQAKDWVKTAKAASLGNMFLEVMNNSYQQNLEKTDDADYATVSALLDAGTEVLFETVLGADIPFREGQSQIRYVMNTYLGELIEEEGGNIFGNVVNTIKDNVYEYLTTGKASGKTQWDRDAIELYKANPEKYQGENGRELAYKDVGKERVKEIISTAITTGFSTIPKAAVSGADMNSGYKRTGKTIVENEQAADLAGMGMQSANTETQELAKKIKKKIDAGKKLSNHEVGRLFYFVGSETNEQVRNVSARVLRNGVTDYLTETYGDRMDAGTKNRVAEIVGKAVREGEKSLSFQERNIMQQYPAAADLMHDMASRENVDPMKRSSALMENVNDTQQAETKALREQAAKLREMETTRQEKMLRSVLDSVRMNDKKVDVAVEGAGAKMASAEDIQTTIGSAAGTPAGIKGRGAVIYEKEDGNKEAGTIVRKEGNSYVVRTADGEEKKVSIEDAKAADETTAAAMAYIEVTEADDQMATDILEVVNSDKVKKDSIKSFLKDARNMYIRGHLDMAFPEKIDYDVEAARALYQKGKAQAAAAEATRAETAKKSSGLKPGEGKVEYRDVDLESLDADVRKQVEAASEIAKRIGYNLVIENDTKNTNKFGEYDVNSGSVVINLAGADKSGGTHHLMVAMAHEVTHLLEHNSPEAYKQLKAFVFKEFTKNGGELVARIGQKLENYNFQINKIRQQNEKDATKLETELADLEKNNASPEEIAKVRGKLNELKAKKINGITTDGAIAEFVADSCDQVLGNDKLISKLANENPNLYEKMKEAVASFIQKVREAIGGMRQSGSIDSIYMKDMDGLAKRWGIALDEVWSKTNHGTSDAVTVEEATGGKQFALRDVDFTEETIKKNKIEVSEMDSVIDFKGTMFKMGGTTLKNEIHEYYKQKYNSDVESDVFGKVHLGRKGIGSSFGHGITETKTAAFEAVPEVIRKGKLIDYKEKYHDENYDTAILAAPIKITDGEIAGEYYVGTIIKLHPDGNNAFYAHDTLSAVINKNGGKVTVFDSNGNLVIPNHGSHSENDNDRRRITDILQEIPKRNIKSGIHENKEYSFADLDQQYEDAYDEYDDERGEEIVAQAAELAMPNSKVRDKNGKLKVVYHQTNADDFTVFDIGKARATSDIQGAYFAPEFDEYHEYGDKTYAVYLNIENPAYDPEGPDLRYQGSGRQRMQELMAQGYDGIIRTEDGEPYEYVVFSPEQIKSAEAFTEDDDGNLIPLLGRFNPDEEDIRYSFAELDKIAAKAGYTDKVYHGTESFGFTEFNTDDSQGSIFVSYDSPGIAETYTSGEVRSIGTQGSGKGVYSMFAKPGNQLVIDLDGHRYDSIPWDVVADAVGGDEDTLSEHPEGSLVNTRQIAEFAKRRGYDSVRINGIYDNGGIGHQNGIETGYGDVGIFFNPADVKSADEFTYDDEGKLIPRSERFNSNKTDIRFSLSEQEERTLQENGIALDAETGSAYQYSFASWGRSEYVNNRDEMIKTLARNVLKGETPENLKKAADWIDSINNVAKIIADHRAKLDYKASPGRSSFKSNPEYGGSIDSSTICAKRRLQTGTIDAIQNALPDFVMQAEDLLRIRKMMKDRNYEVSCGLCFVESSRKNIAKYANQFLKEWNAAHPENTLTMPQINTVLGIEDTRLNNKDAYEAYEKFMNKLAQRKPKLFEMRAEYDNDILKHFRTDDSIEKKNKNGGMRINSFSDFEIVHLIDMMQVIMDMSNVGLAGQAYTKVKEFAEALGPTGLKINMSLIAGGVDENGKLIFDEVEGMKWADVEEMRNKYPDNVGSIVVVFSEDELKAAMADDRIDFIIPFHRSQWKKSNYADIGLRPDTKDFTYWQNERYAQPVWGTKKDGSKKKLRASNYMPNEYWDFKKSGKENAEAYLKMCAENNKIPKFWKWLEPNGDGSFRLKDDGSTDGYWKLLIDFKMYNHITGEGKEQMPVQPEFDMKAARRMLKNYKGGHKAFPVAEDVVKDFVAEYTGKRGGVQRKNGKLTLEGTAFSLADGGASAAEWMMGIDPEDLFLTSEKKMVRNYQSIMREMDEIRENIRTMTEAARTAKGDEARKLRINLQTENAKLSRRQAKLNEITGDKLFISLMRNAQETIDTFISGKTEEQVAQASDRMRGKAEEARRTAEEAAKALEAMADREEQTVLRRFFDPALLKRTAAELNEYFGMKDQQRMEDGLSEIGLKIMNGEADFETALNKLANRIMQETIGANGGLIFTESGTTNEDDLYAEEKADIYNRIFGAVRTIIPNIPAAQGNGTQAEVQNLLNYVKQISGMTRQAARGMRTVAGIAEGLKEESDATKAAASRLRTQLKNAIRYFDMVNQKADATASAEQIEQITRRIESKAAKQVLEAQNKWARLIENDRNVRRLAQENLKYRRKINTAYKRMANLILNETDLRNIPEHMKPVARAAIRMILNNDATGQRKLTGMDIKELQRSKETLDRIDMRDGTTLNLNSITDADGGDDVAIEIENALRDIERGISFWNSDKGRTAVVMEGDKAALEAIQRGMSKIYDIVTASQKVFLEGKLIDTANAAYEVDAEARKKDEYQEYVGGLGKLIRGLHKNVVLANMTPEYFFKNLRNNGIARLFKEFKNAEDKYGRILMEAKGKIAAAAQKAGYAAWDMEKKYDVEIGGRKIQLNLGQIMSLQATWKRERTLGPEMSEHLTKGGFVIEQEKENKKLYGRETRENTPIRVTDEDMQNLLGILTAEQKTFVDDMVQILSKDMGKYGNEASMRMFGIEKYKETYYFPFSVWDGVKNKASNTGGQVNPTNNNRAAHQSFTNRRRNNAQNAVLIRDFMTVCTEHINQMATYSTFASSIEGMNRVLNFRVMETPETAEGKPDYERATERNIEALMRERYGENAMAYIRDFMLDLNGGAVQGGSGLGQTLMSIFKKNAVGGSLSVALQQPISYIRAATMVDTKYLAAAMDPKYYKGSFEEMLTHSGVAVIKSMGTFDMNFSRGATEWLAPENKSKDRKKAVYDEIEEKTNMLPEVMDKMTWTRMWSAIKIEQQAAHPGMDMTSDAFLDLVGERFNEVMRRTQVYDSILVKSQLMRKQDWFSRSITAFRAEPTLSLNLFMDALMNRKGKEGKKNMAAVAATFILGAIAQAAVKGVMGAGRNPDEKKNWRENFAYRFGAAFVSEANPLSLIPGYDNVVDAFSGNDINDNAWGMIKTFAKSVERIWNPPTGEALNLTTGYRYVEDTVGQIAQMFTGVPVKNLMRDSRATVNNILAKFTGTYAQRGTSGAVIKYQAIEQMTSADLIGVINKYTGNAIWDSSSTAYAQAIHQAEKRGDEGTAAGIREYLTLGKGKSEDTINSAVKSAAKKDTSMTTAERAAYLLDKGYEESTSWITSQFKEGNLTEQEVKDLYKQYFPDKKTETMIWNFYKQEYIDGNISREEAEKKYKETYPNANKDDIWEAFDAIDYTKETGKPASGAYYRLHDAIEQNDGAGITKAVKLLSGHGKKKNGFKSSIEGRWKDTYVSMKNGSAEKVKLRDGITKAMRAAGYTNEEISKMFDKWTK